MFCLLKKLVIKYRKYIFILLFIELFSLLVGLFVPYISGIFVNIIVYSPNERYLKKFFIIVISIGLIYVLLSYFKNILKSKFKIKASYKFLVKTLSHLQKISLQIFNQYNPAYLAQRIQVDCSNVINFLFDNFLSIFLNILSITILFIILFNLNFQIFLLSLVFIPIYILGYYLFQKPIYDSNIDVKESQNNFFSKFHEQLEYNTEIKYQAGFDLSILSVGNQYKIFYQKFIKCNKITYLFSSFDGVISILFQGLILLIAGFQIIDNKMTIGEYTVINVYFGSILSMVKFYFNLGQKYQEVKSSAKRMEYLLSIEKEFNGIYKLEDIEEINLENIIFSYGENKKILDNFSYKFEKNNIYVIMGSNGSGKTTLIKIILGILSCDFGYVKYNNINITDIDMYSLRRENISIMSQNQKSMHLTVREFLFADSKDLSNIDLLDILKKCKVYSDFVQYQFCLLYYLDKNLDNLSDGQRQLLTIVKMFMAENKLIILDEPTSYLSQECKKLFFAYLNIIKENKIIIVVTHDEKVVDNSENIFKINI